MLLHSVAEDNQNQVNWRCCAKCSRFTGMMPTTAVSVGRGRHQPNPQPAPDASNLAEKKPPADWRFCEKCSGLFWNGDPKFKATALRMARAMRRLL